ncbi:MAG: SGNH/GDSL hydrolase family protein [Gemmatimonadales bacterium]
MLRRLAGALRTGWTFLGITLLFALGLEGAYRLQGAARSAVSPSARGLPHPNAAEPWWPAWDAAAGAVNGPSRFDPYRSWWALPFKSRWVHVDDRGERVTLPPLRRAPVRRILFLGGSVMWGYTVPDSLTIPSLVRAGLLARGDSLTELRNLAQPSYNATQGLITLMLELRAGYRPDLVISLDGNNDVLATITEGHAGAAFGERDLARRSAVGSRGFWASLLGLTRYSALLARLARSLHPTSAVTAAADRSVRCDSTLAAYTAVEAMAEGLAARYGFQVLYLWQPHPATSVKPKTPWEQAIRAEQGFPALMQACTAEVEGAMRARGTASFKSLAPMFDRDTVTVFLDGYGHLTPAAHRQVADSLLAWIPSQ